MIQNKKKSLIIYYLYLQIYDKNNKILILWKYIMIVVFYLTFNKNP